MYHILQVNEKDRDLLSLGSFLSTLGATSFGQLRVVSSPNEATVFVGSRFSKTGDKGKGRLASLLQSFSSSSLEHLYNARYFYNTCLSLTRELDVSNLSHQFTFHSPLSPFHGVDIF